MSIIGEYDSATVHPNGCGGVEMGGLMFLNSGGATATNLSEFDVYSFPLEGYSASNPPNTPAPAVLYSDDQGDRDAHGMFATRRGRYLWALDRRQNKAEVIDLASLKRVGTVDLTSPDTVDPSPDISDVSPSGRIAFTALRGPNPLSGDPHASTGSTPGLGVIQLDRGGRTGTLRSIVRVSNRDAAGVERADPHGLQVRFK
jgi:hypothetical protein